jgi:hypothetical protein
VPSVKPHQELDYDPHLDPQLVWAGKQGAQLVRSADGLLART